MTYKNLFKLLAMVGIAVIAVGSVLAVRQARAQGSTLEGELAPQAGVGTGFTYQGRLASSSSGEPVAGPCDFEFSLWDDGAAGNQVGNTQTSPNVALDNGYFDVGLDFGGAVFQGDARYLQIAVRCPAGSGSYTVLSGRVELTAAPYAHGLRPGVVISGTGTVLQVRSSSNSGYAFKSETTATTGNASGIIGESKSPNGAGVGGVHNGSSGGYGLWGSASSPTGYGVYGIATAASGLNFGVYGQSNSPSGYAVYADGRAYVNGALHADGNLTAASNAAIDGDLTVYGQANVGAMSWYSKTSYAAVSAAAFRPREDGYAYTNYGYVLVPENTSSRRYNALVQLPHGATVTKMTFYWNDNAAGSNGCSYLYRSNLPGMPDTLGMVCSSGDPGDGSSETTSITNPTVDNSQHAYFLEWDLEGGGTVRGYSVVIEYTITEPY